MPQTKSGVNYYLRNPDGASHYSEHWVQGTNQVTTEVQLSWDDWNTFVNDMMGYSGWVSTNLSRSLPETHPDYSFLVPVDIELREVTGIPIGAAADFDFSKDGVNEGGALAVASVTWRAVTYNAFLGDAQLAAVAGGGEWLRFTDIDKQWSVSNLAVVGTKYRWADGAAADFPDPSGKGAVQLRYSFGTFTYTWHQVPSVLDATTGTEFVLPPTLLTNWANAEGTINSSVFDTYAAGTLLCGAIQYKKTISAVGKIEFEVQIPLQYQAVGWNFKFRPWNASQVLAPGFYQVQGVGKSPNGVEKVFDPYQSSDFTKIWKNA